MNSLTLLVYRRRIQQWNSQIEKENMEFSFYNGQKTSKYDKKNYNI